MGAEPVEHSWARSSPGWASDFRKAAGASVSMWFFFLSLRLRADGSTAAGFVLSTVGCLLALVQLKLQHLKLEGS